MSLLKKIAFQGAPFGGPPPPRRGGGEKCANTPSVGREPIADTADRLEIARILGIWFDLAPEARDLNIHGATRRICSITREFQAIRGLMQRTRQSPQKGDFGFRNADSFTIAGKFTPIRVERAAAQRQGLRAHWTRSATPQNSLNSKQEFLGLKRFTQVIVHPRRKPLDPIRRLVTGGEHQNRSATGLATLRTEALGEGHAIFSRHHDIEDHQIEVEGIKELIRGRSR